VLAAYNCGEGRVLRIISGQHINYLDRFWDLYNKLPNETARYVPRFLATLEIIKDPRKYGMDLEAQTDRQSAYVYETVTTNKSMNLQDIASRIDVSEDLLCILNAELRYKKTPDREYRLKIPPESMEKLVKVMDEIPQADKPLTAAYSRSPALIRHKVRAGETLASIAHRYKTTVKAIRTYNKSLRRSSVKAGQNLSIPIRSSQSAKVVQERGEDVKKVRESGGNTRYKVRRGDTLFSLAKRFDTSVPEIKKMNNIRGNVLKAGQVIVVR
ncbi:MAG: LysM peptidoglycan-binding domain-containing protein, partial [Syntrophales bacterium]|nr:LysM peptidoglycan-binding domain-containing protein [Syntrophales bacterium]